jgi:hypothetical protein
LRRSGELLVESVVIGSILIAITIGGSIATTLSPSSFANINNPASVPDTQNELRALALYYNATLASIGAGKFANASLLLATFRFVSIPSTVDQTATAATAALGSVSSASQLATSDLGLAQDAIAARGYLNATTLVGTGCGSARSANESLESFRGDWTPRFLSLSVPTSLYLASETVAFAQVRTLLADCSRLEAMLPNSGSNLGLALSISSPESSVDTGGMVPLQGTLTLNGTGVGGQQALFYINGTYFGDLPTDGSGALDGSLTVPFIYEPVASVQAIVAPNATDGIAGSQSNVLHIAILFNRTMITVADPSAYLPTQSFGVSGSLVTTAGRPLADAPVKVTFFGGSLVTSTDTAGDFRASLTVPANATDGTYPVYVAFEPQDSFGPSSNLTSIQVVHLPLTLSVEAPFSFAGFMTRLTGTAVANGTAASGASVEIQTPWGSYTAVTDGSGRFSIDTTVSPFDFGFTGVVQASATPAQPYVAAGSASTSIGTFNVLVLVIPGVVVGAVTYEADKTGAFEGLRRRLGRMGGGEAGGPGGSEKKKRRSGAPGPDALSRGTTTAGAGAGAAAPLPELIDISQRAMEIASARFGPIFSQGQTIREVLAVAETRGSPEGYEPFRRILLTAEDFLYAPRFDPSRVEGARTDIASLERYWR